MKFELTDEQRHMVATVRQLTQERFKGRAQKFMNGDFPWENMKELAELGILGMAGICLICPASVCQLVSPATMHS